MENVARLYEWCGSAVYADHLRLLTVAVVLPGADFEACWDV
jgi:hypothetical protein